MSAYSSDLGAESSLESSWRVEATRRMNRMYRRQRYIYNGTRRYYLLGRDQLIAGLRPVPGASVLEIGCGTGRNLVLAARRHPDAQFFGIDVSTEMLTSAVLAVSRRGPTNRSPAAQGDATGCDTGFPFDIRGVDHRLLCYIRRMFYHW